VPDSPRGDARPLRCALLAAALALIALAGCGTGVPDVSVPSIPAMPDGAAGGSATFDIDGVTFQVAQSGTVKADFPESRQITYSGPLGCAGHYFTGHYTENIEVFFHYFKDQAYLLIDNGAEPVYRFGPPVRTGNRLTFSNPSRGDRKIAVVVDCPTGA
jgi:hypothetical protein